MQKEYLVSLGLLLILLSGCAPVGKVTEATQPVTAHQSAATSSSVPLSLQQGWNLISLPLGVTSPGNMYKLENNQWQPVTGTLEKNKAYFLDAAADSTLSLTQEADGSLSLVQGWNAFGVLTSKSLSGLRLVKDNTPYSFAEAAQRGFIRNTVYSFSGGTYHSLDAGSSDALSVGTGYLVHAEEPMTLLLAPPPFQSVSSPQAQCIPPPAGMVGWWPGDGDANDAKGNNNGELQGSVGYTDEEQGHVGRAFSFSGGKVVIPHSGALSFEQNAQFSVDAWIFRTETNKIMHVLGKRNGCDDFNYQIAFDESNGLHFSTGAGTVSTHIQPPLNTWMHIAATADGSQLKFYINGELQGTADGIISTSNAADLVIGASGTCLWPWKGRIDEVEMFNRALSAQEIKAMYDAGKQARCRATTAVQTIDSSAQACDRVCSGGNVVFAGSGSCVSQGIAESCIYGCANGQCKQAPTGENCVSAPEGLISWYKGEDNAHDALTAHTGTLHGGTYGAGFVGRAFELDGTNGYVALGQWSPSHLSLRGTPKNEWTVESWVKPTALPTKGSNGVRRGIAGGFDDCSDWGIALDYAPNSDNLMFGIVGRPTPQTVSPALAGCVTTVSSGVVPVLNQWYHVAGTYDGTVGKIYVNGELKATEPLDSPRAGVFTTYGTQLGGEVCSPCATHKFPGMIDETSFYDRVLSADEIKQIYDAGTRGKCAVSANECERKQGSGSCTTQDGLQGTCAQLMQPCPAGSTCPTVYYCSGPCGFCQGVMHCDATTQQCVQCLSDAHCSSGQTCSPQKTCVSPLTVNNLLQHAAQYDGQTVSVAGVVLVTSRCPTCPATGQCPAEIANCNQPDIEIADSLAENNKISVYNVPDNIYVSLHQGDRVTVRGRYYRGHGTMVNYVNYG